MATIGQESTGVASPRKGKGKVKKSIPSLPVASSITFQDPQLEAAFVAYSQLVSHHIETESLPVRIRKRLKSEIEFIANTGFANADAAETILGHDLLADEFLNATKPSKVPDLPPHLKRMCEMRLLRPEEEKQLFSRMNYLRFRAQQFRSQLDEETSTERDLIRIEALLQAANWHRDIIVQANIRLVMSIIKKFVNSSNAFDDLLSDGTMALLRAADKFDYDRGFRFSTYATQVVRRNAYRNVMQRQNDKLRTAVSTSDASIDVCSEERTGMDEVRWQQLRTRLSLMLDQLDRREKLIIRARFSLGGHRRVQTLQRLADSLGVSKERVRQIEKRALDKLRGFVDKSPLDEGNSVE